MKKLFAAGFLATLAMTALMYMGPVMGLPEMSIANMLGTMFASGPGLALAIGLLIHFMMGSLLFPLAYHFLFQPGAGSGTPRGLWFGAGLWALANFMIMPMMSIVHPLVRSGAMRAPGLLMLNLGAMAPLGSLAGHLLYGALLGKLAGAKQALAAPKSLPSCGCNAAGLTQRKSA